MARTSATWHITPHLPAMPVGHVATLAAPENGARRSIDQLAAMSIAEHPADW
jgi:hypothetical protein